MAKGEQYNSLQLLQKLGSRQDYDENHQFSGKGHRHMAGSDFRYGGTGEFQMKDSVCEM